MKLFALLLPAILFLASCQAPQNEQKQANTNNADSLRYPNEKHLANIKQLTFGGDNAEAYFSFDNQYLSFQATNPAWGTECDQIYYMPITGYTGDRPTLISTGEGRTTCAYFMPGDTSILFASTHLGGASCPSSPRMVNGKYVWHLFNDFDIFTANLKGKILNQLTKEPGYDAEATLSPDGKKIVFTSTRSGDIELYTMNADGSDVKQVTKELGYDGGAFFTPDNKQLIFRASRPKTPEEVATYKELLKEGMVQPTALEIFVCNVDGSGMRQITNLGGANWAPYMHPSGNKLVFVSNHHSASRRQFNVFSINTDGTGLEQITFDEGFDSFPMFSKDGKKIVFASNRNNHGTHDTNIFIADWVE